MAATMKDLAKETGLGLATISSYFNGGNVRKQNREKIEIAVRKLDFEINEVARGLKKDHTKMIGVVIPELNSIFCAQIITEVEDVLRNYGYAMVVSDCRTNINREKEAVEFLLHKRVDGLIIMPTSSDKKFLERFLSHNKPIVLIDRKIDDIECDCVLVDNEKAVEEAVSSMIDIGHREIGMIAGPIAISTSMERLNGYKNAMLKAGLSVNESLIENGDFTMTGGAEAMENLLDNNKHMTAVLVSNYEMTIGAMITLNEREVKIPKELSVIGYDNKEFAKASNPTLSIISQPTKEIGKKVAELLISRLGENDGKERQIIKLDTTFLEGRSVRGGTYE